MDISTQLKIERSYSKKLVAKDVKSILLLALDTDGIDRNWNMWTSMEHEPSKAQRIAEFEYHMSEKDITIHDVMAQIMVTLHMTYGETILQSLCGQTSYLIGGACPFDNALTIAEIVMLMQGIAYTAEERGHYTLIRSSIDLPQGLKDRISNTSYVPPMVVEPIEYTSNYDGGYYEYEVNLLTGKNQHNKKQNLDFINTMNRVPMSLDTNVLELPRVAKYSMDTAVKRKNFDKLIADTKRVVDTILDAGNKFYFLYRFDARGRSYASGYQISPMGDDYSKALINLNTEELIDESY